MVKIAQFTFREPGDSEENSISKLSLRDFDISMFQFIKRVMCGWQKVLQVFQLSSKFGQKCCWT